MLQGLALRRAILEALAKHQADSPETPFRDTELAKRLGVDVDRVDAHFVFLRKSGHIEFLGMPGPDGNRMRFVNITSEGEKYLKNPRNFEPPKGIESPFKVVERSDEKVITDFPALRRMVEATEWVLDDEKPEILAKLDELGKVLADERFNPGPVSDLKLYFERHKWLSPHVAGLIKRRFGF